MGKGAFLELLDAYKRGLSDATYTLMKMVLQPTPQNCLIMETWPSGLGNWQDNEHRTLHALERTVSIRGYGNVSLFLRRSANISSD